MNILEAMSAVGLKFQLINDFRSWTNEEGSQFHFECNMDFLVSLETYLGNLYRL